MQSIQGGTDVVVGSGFAADDADDSTEWERAHHELERLAKTRAGLDWLEGQWLLRALRAGTHIRLGFAGFPEYAERLFGYSPRLTHEKLRVAEALDELAELSQALRDGELNWSAVRELTRVAVPRTEGEWLDAARGRTVREIERLVSGRRPGDRPDDKPDPEAERHVLRFEVSSPTLALMRDAMSKARRDAGQSLDDDAVLMLLARGALGGPKDEGRASYQILLTMCEHCRRAEQQGGGEFVVVGPDVVEMAECDGQHLPSSAEATHVGMKEPARPRATQTIPPATRREVMRRDGGRCIVPGCRHIAWLDIHHLDPRAEGGTHDPERMACLCGAHHAAAHAGRIIIDGSASTGFVVRHADGTRYGGAVSPKAANMSTKVFQALTHMGFRESEARQALERAAVQERETSFQALLRRALGALSPEWRD